MRGLTVTKVAAVAGSVTLLTTGCLSWAARAPTPGVAVPAAVPRTVQIMFGFGGDQTQGFKDSLNPWAKKNGIKINYVQASSFDTLIRSKVAGNNAPDIALFPQPGLLKDIAEQGKLQPLTTSAGHGQAEVRAWSPASWTPATVDGKHYGVPVSMNVKSLVFYPKQAWAAGRLPGPQDHRRADRPHQQDQGHGTTPWCMGMESGRRRAGRPPTGSRQPARAGRARHVRQVGQPPDPVQRPGRQEGRARLREIALANGNVLGGRKPIVSTAFATSANPMFNSTLPAASCTGRATSSPRPASSPTDVVAHIDNQVGVFQFPRAAGRHQVDARRR